MKSYELKEIKKVAEKKIKKVLLINCRRKDYVPALMPHIGLGILAGILTKRGHEVLVVDYLLAPNAPVISEFLEKFQPDVIGLTSYTFNIKAVKRTIDEIREFSDKTPIIVGGPHATMFPDDFNNKIDYIVLRDGELVIIDLVENAKRQKKPKFIEAEEFANLDDIPFPNYQCFYKWETTLSYPIYTSRGCPHQCNFCSIWNLCKRKWRARSPEKCIEELKLAKKNFQKDLHIMIVDDSPGTDIKIFTKFLKLYLKSNLRMRLDSYNVRADNITEELLILLKKIGTRDFIIAVEHIDPEVCRLMNKGETVKQIEKAIKLIKKYGFRLTLFFMIGLPKDTFEKTKECIKFAQKYNPYEINWNIFGYIGPSRALDWFKKHGKIDDIKYSQPIEKKKIFYPAIKPFAEYSEFTKYEIEKAYFMAILRTIVPCLRLRDTLDILKVASKYNLYKDFLYWLPRGFIKSFKKYFYLFQSGTRSLRKEGFIKTFKKIIYLGELGRL